MRQILSTLFITCCIAVSTAVAEPTKFTCTLRLSESNLRGLINIRELKPTSEIGSQFSTFTIDLSSVDELSQVHQNVCVTRRDFSGRASQFSSLKWGQKCAELTVFNEFNGI